MTTTYFHVCGKNPRMWDSSRVKGICKVTLVLMLHASIYDVYIHYDNYYLIYFATFMYLLIIKVLEFVEL